MEHKHPLMLKDAKEVAEDLFARFDAVSFPATFKISLIRLLREVSCTAFRHGEDAARTGDSYDVEPAEMACLVTELASVRTAIAALAERTTELDRAMAAGYVETATRLDKVRSDILTAVHSAAARVTTVPPDAPVGVTFTAHEAERLRALVYTYGTLGDSPPWVGPVLTKLHKF